MLTIGLLISSGSNANKAAPSGTIVLNPGSITQLGGIVWFDWIASRIPGGPKSDPRIQVLCYQGTLLVYGEAGPADHIFLLGGASSSWLNGTSGADPYAGAHCVADLYYWSYKGTQQFNLLASVEFDAVGL